MSQDVLLILLTIITIMLLIISGVIFYLYLAQKNSILRTFQKNQTSAYKEAMEQLGSWRQHDLEAAKIQMKESARVEMEIQFEQWKNTYTQGIRQEAIQKSQSIIAGKVTEHFIPYLPKFTYNPKDARFLGSPIDFIIFDGLDEGILRSIVFAEIKTGASSLNTRERQIRDIVKEGKISWIEIRSNVNLTPISTDESNSKEIANNLLNESETQLESDEKKNISERLQSVLKN